MIRAATISSIAILLSACAGMSPNAGETTTDNAWNSGDFSTAYTTAEPYAQKGEPWAQLRLGIFYENGWGVEKDAKQASFWYQKAASQLAEGNWANGQTVGATGKSGYFNQNSDALIAKFNLAQMYFSGEGIERDLNKSLLLVDEVIEKSKGEPVYFCCEYSDPRYFTQVQFVELKQKVQAALSIQ